MAGDKLGAMAHPGDETLHRLSLGRLSTAESLHVQRHIFKCADCLKRLIEVELMVALTGPEVPSRGLPPANTRKPLFIRHDTADGFIYSRVERRGSTWLARHWGKQLQGQRE